MRDPNESSTELSVLSDLCHVTSVIDGGVLRCCEALPDARAPGIVFVEIE